MTENAHLQAFDLTLTTLSPLYVGSGNVLTKTEYLFNARTGMVRVLDIPNFLTFLAKQNLVEAYEQFILSGNTNLYGFLKDCGISSEEISNFCQYSVYVGDALDSQHTLKEIHTFQRNSFNQAYIPGSSVKGALRTAILCAMMEDEQKGKWPTFRDQAKKMAILEGEYLNTLKLKKAKDGSFANDAVNSIMRGISVSDSLPISENAMILAGKYDANPLGEVKKLPLCRECIAPGTKISFRLTLDQSVLKGNWSAQDILHYIQRFDSFYRDEYLAYFASPRESVSIPLSGCLILGGGSGFFAKNLIYPWFGGKDGLKITQQEMSQQFPKHGHKTDAERYQISPHMMKYTKYQGKLYPYGYCGVTIQ